MKKIVNYFIQGALYIAPIGITVYIIFLIFSFIDSLLNTTLYAILGIQIPGLGAVMIILLLILVGMFGQSIISTPIKALFKRFLDKTPFLKLIYSAFNDLLSAFVGKEKKFNKPVLVTVNPATNLQKVGFLTATDLSSLGEKDKVAVYFPQSYTFAGDLFIVPSSQVKMLDINPADAMKFIISAGVSGIENS